jgi:starvation-inducible outer membrane lipoprotein
MNKEAKDVIYLLAILGGILLIIMLAGCKSLPGNLEIDTPFFDIEYEGKTDA